MTGSGSYCHTVTRSMIGCGLLATQMPPAVSAPTMSRPRRVPSVLRRRRRGRFCATAGSSSRNSTQISLLLPRRGYQSHPVQPPANGVVAPRHEHARHAGANRLGGVERDVEDTVIRPLRTDALDAEPDDADTRLVTRLRPPAVDAPALGVAAANPDAPNQSSSQGTDALQASAAPAPSPAAASTYRFTVNSHEPIELDRPAHIGRRPSLPRVPQRVRPRLVRVPSPKQEVSSTHLEVRQEGASVILTDLR